MSDENGNDCPDCDLCLVCCCVLERSQRLRDQNPDCDIGKGCNSERKTE